MKGLSLKILKFFGFLSIGVILLYFAFRGINPGKIANEILSARYSWVLLSLVFAMLAYLSRAYRWNMIIEPLGYKPSFRNTFYAMMTGYLANFAFPRLGEITRCASLSKKENIPADKLIGTVIVERVIDLLCLFILLVYLLLMKFDTFGHFLNKSVLMPLKDKMTSTLGFSWILWLVSGLLMIAVILLYYLVFRESLNKVKSFYKFKNIIKGILDGLKTIYLMKRRTEFIIHSVFIWGMYLLMTWVVVFALPATSGLKLIDGLFILVIGGLGMTAPVQSGIGAFHWIVSRGIVSVYPFITMENALAFAVISHGFQSLIMILLGGFSLFMLFYRKNTENKSMGLLITGPVESKSKTA